MPGRIAWILVIAILIVAIALGVMHLRHQPAVLIYDEAWSEKAGEAAMIYASEMKVACQKQAIDGQNEFKGHPSACLRCRTRMQRRACTLPTLRAASIDPARALRQE